MFNLSSNQRSLALPRGRTLLPALMLTLGLMALVVTRLLLLPAIGPASAISLDFSQLPLSFVPNVGQTDHAVHFQVHDRGSTIFLTSDEAVLALPATETTALSAVRLRFEGANPNPAVVGVDRLPGVVNYFVGNNPTRWHTDLPTYAGIVYRQLYPGIDLRYDGASGQIKGTYTVAPGANPSHIRWRHAGAKDVRLDAPTGNLLIAHEGHNLIEKAPTAWQDIDGQRVLVSVRYVLADDGSASFAVGKYDPSWPLIIDPTLIYSTYLGGSGFDEADGIALDSAGNIYVAGTTSSTDFPTEVPYQPSSGGGQDVFVAKINAAGDALAYSTYLGGGGCDHASGIALDSAGNAYATGHTDSTDFPTHNPLQARGGLSDAFVVKLNAAGNGLVYSTYLGGSNIDQATGIAVDSGGNAYVTGTSFSGGWLTDSPMRAYSGNGDAFVTKLNGSGSALVYGTYLGGSGSDFGSGIAVDGSGQSYVAGETFSTDFPTEDPLQAETGGSGDLFVAKLNSSGSGLLYSTYLGGSESDYGYGIAVDSIGNAHVTGQTESSDFPTTEEAFDTTCGTDGNCNKGTGFYTYGDAFVAKLNDNGNTLLYSTYLGGSDLDKGYGITVDSTGHAYITGDTYSDDFPTDGSLQGYGGGADAFVVKLNDGGSTLLYSTYLGGGSGDYGTGIAVDNAGNAMVAGITFSEDLPTQDPLQDTHGGGDADAFVAKINDAPSATPPPSSNLRGSDKTASQYVVTSDETLTYTIRLRNSGLVMATATVTDPVPAEMEYVPGSVTGGGVYDPDTRTVTWSDVTVDAGEHIPLSFAVTTTTVTTPTLVVNTATIAADGDSFERQAWVLLVLPGSYLHASCKTASEYMVTSDETLTYTIHLRNWGTIAATVTVTDPVPAEVDYVPGSVTEGGVYDPDTETLTWSDVTVAAGEEKPLSFAVTASTVTTPTLVINTAHFAGDGDSFERHAWVLLRPPSSAPNLRGSYKTASRHQVASGDTLTYTIWLHNSSTVTATVVVTDPVPAEMEVVPGSVTGGGVYDPDTATISWSDVTVPPGHSQSLSFAVTATPVDRATLVINTATISTDGDSFERWFAVLLLPEAPDGDVTRPVVHSLTIDEQDVLTDPAVTLHISATDDISVTEMYLREWEWRTSPVPHWRTVQSSGWVPFEPDYAWSLGEESGTHFVGVWVTDGASNRSWLNRQAIDFASLLMPGETIARHGIVPYQVYYEAGIDVTASLAPTDGDADLYVWYPGHFFWPPDQESTLPGTATDEVDFTTPRAGTYLFLVHGYTAATYDLSITPGGGPRAWGAYAATAGGISQAAFSEVSLAKPPIQDLVASLFESGLDPLGSPAAFRPFEIYLPIVSQRP